MTELKFNIGRAVACLSFETAMMATRPGRRLIERLTRAADLASDNFEIVRLRGWTSSKAGFPLGQLGTDDETVPSCGAACLSPSMKVRT